MTGNCGAGVIASKCESVEEAYYYLQRTIDEGLRLLE